MKLLIILFITTKIFAGSLEIMSYNVENLFDVEHDTGKSDWTFLPKNTIGKKEACQKINSKYRRQECFETDWTSEKLDLKLNQIAKVLTTERKTLPNILAVSEIENEAVVALLAKKLGYSSYYVSESPDERGIDLGIMFNELDDLKYISKREHVLKAKYFKKRPSRNILEVQFLLNKKYNLYIFVNHWPSLSNPDDARGEAATLLKNRMLDVLKNDKDALIIALGDFNTIDKLKKKGNKHPFKDILLQGGSIMDLSEITTNSKNPPGTYYYARGNEWNTLDRVFLSSNLADSKNPDIDLNSYEIYAPRFITTPEVNHFEKKRSKYLKYRYYPKRYDHNTSDSSKAGFSDHFPIIFKVNY